MTEYSRLPQKRYGLSREQCIISDKIYVTHGMGSQGPFYNNCFEYDINSNVWIERSPALYPRDGTGTCIYNNKLYVFGGRDTVVNPHGLAYAEVYDPKSDTWDEINPLPIPTADPGVTGLFHDGKYKIFVVGGYGKNPFDMLGCVQVYLPENDRWEYGKYSEMIPPRWPISAIYLNNYIFCYGGWYNRKSLLNYSMNIIGKLKLLNPRLFKRNSTPISQKYSINENRWEFLRPMPAPLSESLGWTMAILDYDKNEIHVFNGYNRSHYIHDTVRDKYICRRSMPVSKRWSSVSYYDKKIFTIGGGKSHKGEILDIMEVYDTELDIWNS